MADARPGSYGNLLQQLRTRAGFTQQELAERANISVDAVSAHERATNTWPYPRTVEALATALDLPASDRSGLLAAAARPRRPRSARIAPAPVGADELRTPSHNLPNQLTSFIGRREELADLAGLLKAHRLVTVVGPGGVGKTRTTLQVASTYLDGLTEVWLAELGPLTDGAYVTTAIAQAVGAAVRSDARPLDDLVGALRRKRILLVVDNCEHLMKPATDAIEAILRGCPLVKVLASSRQRLGMGGEHVYRLSSLPVPTASGTAPVTAKVARTFSAVALFLERARSADSRFALTDENARDVAEICRRLDGIPHAIELAASRIGILSPRQLRDHLDVRFATLAPAENAPPRQQTLRACIDWSYELLDRDERKVLRRVGVFADGFSLDGALAVGSQDDLERSDVLRLLASLVDKSLVLTENVGDIVRYHLLESVREYARERLEEAGERNATQGRQLRYLRDRFALTDERYQRTGRWSELEGLLTLELENTRQVLDFATGAVDAHAAGALMASSAIQWSRLGLVGESLRRVNELVLAIPDDDRLTCRLWTAAAWLAEKSGASAARALEAAERAVAHGRRAADPTTLCAALKEYAWVLSRGRRFTEANAALVEAERLASGSTSLRLGILESRAYLSELRGDLRAATDDFYVLRTEHRALGNVHMERLSAASLAEVEHAVGRTKEAIAIVRDLLSGLRSQSDRGIAATVLANFAGYHLAVDELREACDISRDVLAHYSDEPRAHFVAWTVEHFALGIGLSGDLTRSALLAGYAEEAIRSQAYEREFTERATHERLDALLRSNFAPDERLYYLSKGAALSHEAAVALALDFQTPPSADA